MLLFIDLMLVSPHSGIALYSPAGAATGTCHQGPSSEYDVALDLALMQRSEWDLESLCVQKVVQMLIYSNTVKRCSGV